VRREISAWTRDHPWQADGLLAAALLGFSVPQIIAGQAGAAAHATFTAVTVLLVATVLARRRYPVAAFAVAAVIGAVQIALGVQNGGPGPVFAFQPTNADVTILVLLYTLAAYRPRPVSIAGLVVCLLGSAVAIARWSPAHGAHPAGALFGAIPVALTVAVTERPSPAIEAMAYFCTAELLANVTKHSGASHVTISVAEPGSGLVLTVTDDGHGGARLVPGGGLAGLLERVQTVDGRLEVDSPPGGPTIVTIELPRHA
jgi:hypothetical protein